MARGTPPGDHPYYVQRKDREIERLKREIEHLKEDKNNLQQILNFLQQILNFLFDTNKDWLKATAPELFKLGELRKKVNQESKDGSEI